MRYQNLSTLIRLAALGLVTGALAGCQDTPGTGNTRAYQPIPAKTVALMQSRGTDAHAPILIRTFKKEAEFEIWKQKPDGKYVHLKTYPMCRWSGQLGPKAREGDRQVPEGFYAITPGQMNPNSNYYLSFNVGYPNAYDRALGHTGGLIMVHGACSSAGCFSMTDDQIAEIYAIARESFGGGQRSIQMQSLPFHMTAENLAKHRLDSNMPFWRQLKEGSDAFEVAKREPSVGVCGKRYVFGAKASDSDRFDASGDCPRMNVDPEIKSLVAEKQQRDEARVAELAGTGVLPVRMVYADGGQHPSFASHHHDVSRPEALASAPVEIALDSSKAQKSSLLKVAAAKSNATLTAEKTGDTKTGDRKQGDALSVAQKSGSEAESTIATGSTSVSASGSSGLSSLLSFRSSEPKAGASPKAEMPQADQVSSSHSEPDDSRKANPARATHSSAAEPKPDRKSAEPVARPHAFRGQVIKPQAALQPLPVLGTPVPSPENFVALSTAR